MKRLILIVAVLILPMGFFLCRFRSAGPTPASSDDRTSGVLSARPSHPPRSAPRLSLPGGRSELPAPSPLGPAQSLALIDTVVAEIDQQLHDETDAATRAKLLAYSEALGQMRHEIE